MMVAWIKVVAGRGGSKKWSDSERYILKVKLAGLAGWTWGPEEDDAVFSLSTWKSGVSSS